ncbi:small-conductance mechanosensitive channel [Povalibacter uvarum]|uniref:Small-conductance mechanosensitive channel n=1 Tax=Povalibacter uvarum TaxID=732238 RepID=A0A841HL78_9GAMM|nr:mechanosensitive ion channel family protein [Povalibacter uvarum]MBB6093040.1 small-conductance mechanosensitive channel [Povalibacter uvarum]
MSAKPLLLVAIALLTLGVHAAEETAPTPPAPADSRTVMTIEQVVQLLDETVDWYRTLGMQQQASTQPSDLLILYANRQTADKVMTLAFEIARANAELISSEEGAKAQQNTDSGSQTLARIQRRLDEQRQSVQAELDAAKRQLASADDRENASTRVSVLQRELDLLNARRNYLSSMEQFEHENDAGGFGANTLKAHIDAIAASIPSMSAATPAAATAAAASAPTPTPGTLSFSQFGIWDLTAAVFRLSGKMRTIDAIDQRTADLQEVFTQIRNPPLEQLKALTARGDALGAQSDNTDSATLKTMRDQYDTLAWLFKQTSSMLTPLSRAGVLLDQYRHNLKSWRDATERQYYEALKALGMRVLFFAALLAIVFGAAELWQRAVFRYVHDARRRSRFLLLRRIVIWCLVVAIAASTFATELGSLATFAGLITAGLAVAMQSVLVSVVGYFFLIGKYGIRVGDRVQIGSVTGEVIELGLVRLHLMELGGQGLQAPTGRVVAFANSVIFQASGGLFKQIAGVNLAWHDVTLSLPPGADYAVIKDELVAAVNDVLNDYRDDIVRQSQEIQKAASSNETGDPQPQVQLRFSPDGVEAVVRYPVQLSHAAEIDERVSRELLNVISAHSNAAPRLGAPA